MAIDRFDETLSAYLRTEAAKRDLQVRQALTEKARSSEGGALDKESILGAAQEIGGLSLSVDAVIENFGKVLQGMAARIEDLGFDLPPAEILDRVAKRPTSKETSRFPVQITEDKEPERYFRDDFFLMSDDEFEEYRRFIEDAVAQGQSEVEIQLGSEKRFAEYREGLIKAGIRMNRKISVPISGDSRPSTKGNMRFFVSEPSEYLTFENIENLRNNLGRYSAFKDLPEELLQKNISDLGLEIRTQNILLRSQLGVVSSVIGLTESELEGSRNFGQACFYDLMVSLAYHGVLPKTE